MTSSRPILVVENDSFLRVLKIVLDPAAPARLAEAFGHFCAHDLDFSGWCERMRARVCDLYPADVRLVNDEPEFFANLPGAWVAVVEALPLGEREIAAAGGSLKAVQKYGTVTARIDRAACASAGVAVWTLRRRANISTAEQALALMLALARQLNRTANRISIEQLKAVGYAPTAFDRAHTPNGNWARIDGLRTLFGSQLGIVGLGEIGREVALRAAGLGMRIVYTQRHRLPAAVEQRYQASYGTLQRLLETSDCVSLHLPRSPETRGIVGREQLASIKPGALLINVSQPEQIDRAALRDALASGRLGGLGLDTFYEEPGDAADPLLKFPNVIVTPHLGGSPRLNSLDDVEEIILNLAQAQRRARGGTRSLTSARRSAKSTEVH